MLSVLIKVQFDCDEKYFSKIADELRKIAHRVDLEPERSLNNYCGFYIGDGVTIAEMGVLLTGYYKQGLVTYYEVGHI